jgi:hypothetical protein
MNGRRTKLTEEIGGNNPALTIRNGFQLAGAAENE